MRLARSFGMTFAATLLLGLVFMGGYALGNYQRTTASDGGVAFSILWNVQNLLKQMTQGMAIALYTTLVGLIANLWLGLQLLLLDRTADRLVADILADTPHQPQPALH